MMLAALAATAVRTALGDADVAEVEFGMRSKRIALGQRTGWWRVVT